MFPTVTDLQGKNSPRPTFGPESTLKLATSMSPQTQGHCLWLSEGGTSQVHEKRDLQHEIVVVPKITLRSSQTASLIKPLKHSGKPIKDILYLRLIYPKKILKSRNKN